MNEVVEYHCNNLNKKLKDKKYSTQFLPDCLNFESTVSKVEYKGNNLKTNYLIDIVHNLLLKYYFKKENSFNISSLVLKEKYGHLYNFYIDYLVDKKILILLKKHLKGKNCRIYKLNEKLISGNITRYKNADSILLKKYRKAISSVNNFPIEKNIIDADVKSKLIEDLFSVDIDYSKSIFFLDSSLQEKDIYQKNKYSVESIKDKHIFYHFDEYGRLHTNFTILKSFIRKNCLLIDGEETFEIDIKNSQPLFLNKVIDNCDIKVDSKELELYRILTLSGNFYKYLQDGFGLREKNEVKKITYKILFGKNYNNKTETIFKSIFPSIHNFIKTYKKEKKDYRVLSHELQKYESQFLFNKVIKQINDTHKHIKLLTCHDSIICRQSDRELVKQIFDYHLKNEFQYRESVINI
jgi:hypothetical protein